MKGYVAWYWEKEKGGENKPLATTADYTKLQSVQIRKGKQSKVATPNDNNYKELIWDLCGLSHLLTSTKWLTSHYFGIALLGVLLAE